MLWLMMLFSCRSVNANEPTPTPTPAAQPGSVVQYDHCRVAVLLDRKQNRALAFRVTTNNDIDTATARELTLARDEHFSDVHNQRAKLPFADTAFMEVIVTNDNVFGQTPSDNPSVMPLLPGYRNDQHEETYQGLSGYIYVLDARPECAN